MSSKQLKSILVLTQELGGCSGEGLVPMQLPDARPVWDLWRFENSPALWALCEQFLSSSYGVLSKV